MQTQIVEIEIGKTKHGDKMLTCYFADGNKSNLFTSRDPNKHTAGKLAQDVRTQLGDFAIGDVLELSEPIDVTYDESKQWKDILTVGAQCPTLSKIVDPSLNPEYGKNLRQSVIQQVQTILGYPTTCLFDIESTGLDCYRDEIVSLSIISGQNEVLSTGMIKPTQEGLKRLKSGNSSEIHGITEDMLTDCKTFEEIYPTIYALMEKGLWVAYNAEYDVTLLDLLCDRHLLPRIPRLGVHCAKLLYTDFAQAKNEKGKGYAWLKLTDAIEREHLPVDGDYHGSLFDIQQTYQLMKRMAESD